MRKTIIAAVFMASSPLALASPVLEKIIERDIAVLSKDTSNTVSAKKVRKHVLKRDLKEVMRAWSVSPKQSENPREWGEIGVNILHWAYPEREHRWLSALPDPLGQSYIYQQDSLIDLDRIEYRQGTFSLKKDEMFGYELADIFAAKEVSAKTSGHLLMAGLAPIGPDNLPVKVCTMGRSSAAPYLELSSTQIEKYQMDTGLDFSRCLYGSYESAYWASRYSDMIDAYHDIKPDHNPKGSW